MPPEAVKNRKNNDTTKRKFFEGTFIGTFNLGFSNLSLGFLRNLGHHNLVIFSFLLFFYKG